MYTEITFEDGLFYVVDKVDGIEIDRALIGNKKDFEEFIQSSIYMREYFNEMLREDIRRASLV